MNVNRDEANRRPRGCGRAAAFVVVALPFWLAACGTGDRPPGPEVRMRDSAGVRLVENTAPANRLRLDPVTAVTAAGDEADPAFRLTGITALGDSMVVVANSGGFSIDAYDAAGGLLWRTGREGKGPGEFEGELRIFRYRADSLLAYDWNLRRITVLDLAGQVARTATLSDAEPNPSVLGTLADGSIVVGSRHLRLALGLNVDSTVVALHSPDGARQRVVTSLAIEPVYMTYLDRVPVVDTQPMAAIASVTAFGDGLAVMGGARPAIAVLGTDGSLARIIRWPEPAEAVTPEVHRRWVEWDSLTLADRNPFGDFAKTPDVRSRWRGVAVFPDSTPVTRRIAFDDQGNLWSLSWTPPWERRAEWNVFDPEGRWLAAVELPAAVQGFAAGTGILATIETDSLDVELVRTYAISLGGATTDER
ncbi:MAG: hypothetical protein PVH00_12885 [Gemmatimonadota bacterium]|jgi:hypothetical protein